MTDTDKLTAARRALAQIADQCTEALKNQTVRLKHHGFTVSLDSATSLRIANETLVTIRELAQDAAEATLDKVETRT